MEAKTRTHTHGCGQIFRFFWPDANLAMYTWAVRGDEGFFRSFLTTRSQILVFDLVYHKTLSVSYKCANITAGLDCWRFSNQNIRGSPFSNMYVVLVVLFIDLVVVCSFLLLCSFLF